MIRPALAAEPGADRLLALLETWVGYLRAETFPGGCFVTATSAEYGHRTGAVADAVRALKREWLDLLEREFAAAGAADPATDAFRVDAYLAAANVRRELFGDDAELDRARALATEIVDAAGAPHIRA
ncbi:TetR family transcriptional regulator C-terminal domain-containing protein [Tsukamurella ocularis]|uniref:TetR family transcriptional regulator C-terminal domain-containing protein n=1 Tax=Tsukamurella ocularis TaxID=1970234 RepID=UPI0039EF4A4D